MGQAVLNQIDTNMQAQTVVVGLGKTGLSCVRFLVDQGVDVMVVDSRSEPPGQQALARELPDVLTEFGCFNSDTLNRAETLIVSPGIPLSDPAIVAAIKNGVEVMGDIELFARHATAPIIAITGSNGKSTVTTLVGEMVEAAGFQVAVGGNIGTPALDLLQRNVDFYVLELSSFQLDTTASLKPAVSVVLNVSQDHLDRYDGMDHYAATKRSIYKNAQQAIVNRDDARIFAWAEEIDGALSFGLNAPVNSSDYGVRDGCLVCGEKVLLAISELKVSGSHNVANVLAAFALADAIGLPREAMIKAAKLFSGLAHRCQWIAEQNGVNWYNDSKATNVGAAVAAIEGMSGKTVLLAGGEGKGQDFSSLKTAMFDKGRAAVLFGRDAEFIKAALGDVVVVEIVDCLNDAVNVAQTLAQPGDAVLLAPACASFDMFKGYEDRGEQFSAAVRERLL